MRRDGRRADVDGRSVYAIPQTGPHRDDVAIGVDGRGDAPLAVTQRRLEGLEHFQAAAKTVQPPLLAQCGLHPAQVAGWIVHVGPGDLDEAQPYERVDANRVHLGTLADNLPMHLTVGRNVDDNVAQNLRRTAQASPGAERCALLVVALLDRSELREMVGPRAHPVLGKLAYALNDLAATADSATTTHRIEVDTKRTGRFED